MATGHHERVGSCRPSGPVSQHERVAVKYQVHQGGTVSRGNRPQIGGKTWYIGEQVHRPEPAGESSRPDYALNVPGRLVDQYPAPGLGSAIRQPEPLRSDGTITVSPHSAHFNRGERGAPELWVIHHAPCVRPSPPTAGGQSEKQRVPQ